MDYIFFIFLSNKSRLDKSKLGSILSNIVLPSTGSNDISSALTLNLPANTVLPASDFSIPSIIFLASSSITFFTAVLA